MYKWQQPCSLSSVIFLFPYNPPTPPIPTKPPPAVPTERAWVRSISAPLGSVRVHLAPFGLAPFWVGYGSVSGPFRGVGWGRGGVRERGFCKGKEYHYLSCRLPRGAWKHYPCETGCLQRRSRSATPNCSENDPKGSKRRFPNRVFQIPHLGLRQREALPEGRRMPENTTLFKHFGAFCPCPDHPPSAPLWKTPFRKHRLLLS